MIVAGSGFSGVKKIDDVGNCDTSLTMQCLLTGWPRGQENENMQ